MHNIIDFTDGDGLKGEDKKYSPDITLQREDIISVSDFIDDILLRLIASGASDIHIDPHDTIVTIRARSNGYISTFCVVAKNIHEEIIGRLKIVSKLRTDVHDKGQDGRFVFVLPHGKEKADIRISIVPTFFGENAVLRILRPEAERAHDLISLGMYKDQSDAVTEALHRRQGMIIIAGPTGSGKTTTIYTMLKELADSRKNIVTIEDPIEYIVHNTRQIQVSTQSGFTFAEALRSIVRQDPDVLVVGEMRDRETAILAFQAAQTGHLIITSLHAEDSVGVYPRLLDLGVSSHSMDSIILIISQRLISSSEDATTREGIFEVVQVNQLTRSLLSSRQMSPEYIRVELERQGSILLRSAAARRYKKGLPKDIQSILPQYK